jgi:DNA-binding SARP family transcriptional activator/tetratricopeptide (TPR) repeat protein
VKKRAGRAAQLEADFGAGNYEAVLTVLQAQTDLTAEEMTWLGVSLLRTSQFAQAEEPLELAMALGNDEAAVEYGNLLRATGDNKKAAAHFRALLPRLNGELLFRAQRWYGVVLHYLGEDGAIQAIEAARRGYLSLGDKRMAARIAHTLASVYAVLGELPTALKLLNNALPTLEQDGNRRPLLAAIYTLIDIQVDTGQLDSASETIARAREVAESIHDEYALLQLDSRRSELMLYSGDYGGFCESLLDLADRSEKLRAFHITDYALNHLANHYSRVGEHAAAVRTMGRLRALNPELSLYGRTVLAMMALRRGDTVAALRLHLEVRAEALRRGASIDATRSLLLAAYSAYRMNDLPRCTELLSEALQELAGQPRSQSQATIAPDLQEIDEMLAFARLSPALAPLLEAALEDASFLSGSVRDDLFTTGMRLEIMTLGQELVLRDGIPCAMRARGSVAVLACLALHPRSTRQEVINQLWPDRDPKKAAGYFRQCITDIREAIGADVVLVEGAHQAPEYRLSSKASVILDSQRVLQLIANGQLPAAVAAYKGEFLPSIQDSEWVEEHRMTLQRALVGSLRAELRASQLEGQGRRVVLLATAILGIDPGDTETEDLRLSVAREVSSPSEIARFEAERHRRMN